MKLIECPRDAWQGYHPFIPTDQKARYINKLLEVGFDTIDFGSFVSHRTMPQVSDTAELVQQLDLSQTSTKLLAIVANERGAMDACHFGEISCIGYPFSISETFQLRNTHATISESLARLIAISDLCQKHDKELIIYISMGFGNPYGDIWNTDIVLHWVNQLAAYGVRTFSLADTVGLAVTEDISSVYRQLTASLPDLEIGAHFHTKPADWLAKIEAAYDAGCRRFDGALLGYGGCPMAQDQLVGNMPTEKLVTFAIKKEEAPTINMQALSDARSMFLNLINN